MCVDYFYVAGVLSLLIVKYQNIKIVIYTAITKTIL